MYSSYSYDNNYVLDIGFRLFTNLCPRLQIGDITCSVPKLLGISLDIFHGFKYSISLKSVYCALGQHILEYGTVPLDLPSSRNSMMN